MLSIDHVYAQYRTITGPVPALTDIHFAIQDNEIFGIAGESGCGKSTLLKVLYDLTGFPLELTRGKVSLAYSQNGRPMSYESGGMKPCWWSGISYIPQAAMSVLNPVLRVEEQFFDAMRRYDKTYTKDRMRGMIREYLEELNLPATVLTAFPHQLSGGMRQRVVIAMATILSPSTVLADEPTTALDVVVQRGILTMLMSLQEKLKNTFVLVTHDMGVHYQITHRMGIMYAGAMAELGQTEEIFERPAHPYTQMLIAALPKVGDKGERDGIPGAPPPMRALPNGCRFAPRCPKVTDKCLNAMPRFIEIAPGHYAACHLL